MKKIIIIGCCIGLCSTLSFGKSIWKDRNYYSSSQSLNVGDIVIIQVKDISQLKFNLDLARTSTSNINTNPDMTITGFLPKIASTSQIGSNNSTKFSGKGELVVSVASQVVRKEANGKFAVTGARTYSFNGVTNTITVSGIVDAALVKGRNIDSNNIVNFRLEIRGTAEGTTIQRPAVKENEKVDANLSETDKQKIITDYLQKMVRELTR